jgi:hypothetical protein
MFFGILSIARQDKSFLLLSGADFKNSQKLKVPSLNPHSAIQSCFPHKTFSDNQN